MESGTLVSWRGVRGVEREMIMRAADECARVADYAVAIAGWWRDRKGWRDMTTTARYRPAFWS